MGETFSCMIWAKKRTRSEKVRIYIHIYQRPLSALVNKKTLTFRLCFDDLKNEDGTEVVPSLHYSEFNHIASQCQTVSQDILIKESSMLAPLPPPLV